MLENFINYSAYYDLLYREKDYLGEVNYLKDLFRIYSKNSVHSILEIGSGTGKHANILAKSGYEITGIEPSLEMLKIAQQNAHKLVNFQAGNSSEFELSQTFDACISLFHVISYLNSNEELIASFKNIHQHLNSNGLFIFDCWYSPAVLAQLPEKRVKLLENEMISFKRTATPVIHWNENIVDVNYNIEVISKLDHSKINFEEKHCMRHFSIQEMKFLAELTGFKILHIEEFLTKKKPSQDTWGICFLLQKVE